MSVKSIQPIEYLTLLKLLQKKPFHVGLGEMDFKFYLYILRFYCKTINIMIRTISYFFFRWLYACVTGNIAPQTQILILKNICICFLWHQSYKEVYTLFLNIN